MFRASTALGLILAATLANSGFGPDATPAAAVTQDSEECLLTDTGAPLKVVVRRPTAIYAEADEKSPGQPVQAFAFFYAMPTADNSQEKIKNGFYRVARLPRKAACVGWIKADDVVEWPHRQVGGLRLSPDRDRLLFFANLEDLQKYYADPKRSKVQPISREPENIQKAVFPILDVMTVKVDGDDVSAFRVAYLHSNSGSGSGSARSGGVFSPGMSGGVTQIDLQQNFTLDVCFVIDTTASMEPWIEAMKQVIEQAATAIANDPTLKGRVRFALVCYRDVIEGSGMEYMTKLVCDLKTGADHAEFRRRVKDIHEAEVGSEDWSEEVFAGAQLAISDAGWNPQALKTIVLIGDASGHLDTQGPKNPQRLTIEGVLAAAQPTGANAIWQKILINTLQVCPGNSDEAICRDQFETLTRGRDFAGIHSEYRTNADAPEFIKKLMGSVTTMTQITSDVVEGKTDRIKQRANQAGQGSDESRFLGPVLEMLRASEGDGGQVPTFASGYVCSIDPKGNLAIEAQVMVSKGRLSLFQSAIDFAVKALDRAGDAGSKDINSIVKSLQIIATQINMAEPIDPDLPLEKLLSFVLGIPVKSPIFAMTPRKIAGMTEKDYQAWVAQVRGVEGAIKAHIEKADIWMQLDDKSPRDQDRIAFIKVTDLP